MRIVDGYVVIAKIGGRPKEMPREILYGKSVSNPGHSFQNIESNDFTPFARLKDARTAIRELKDMNFSFESTSLGELWMRICQTPEEIETLANKTNLVVIQLDDVNLKYLMGPYVKGRPGQYPLPGARLIENGFLPYRHDKSSIQTPYERASHLAREVTRQGTQCPINMAQFRLKRI